MEIILTLGQAFEVAYQLILCDDAGVSQALPAPSAPPPPAIAPELVASSSGPNPAGQQQQQQQARKIGPKPTVLPPKPKLVTVGGKLVRNPSAPGLPVKSRTPTGNQQQVTRSNTVVVGGPASSSSTAEDLPVVVAGSMTSSTSTPSMSCNDTVRAPLAAKDEL